MIPKIVYPVPMDAWSDFSKYFYRFTKSVEDNNPEHIHEFVFVANWGEPLEPHRAKTMDMKARWMSYYGHGCDVGSWQHAVSGCLDTDFFVLCTSRVYFHRAGWLNRMMFEREKHGPGLYTTSCSHEGGRLHPCIRCVGIDGKIFRDYPLKYESRDGGTKFETGIDSPHGSLGDFVKSKGGTVKLVTWDGCYDEPDWFMVKNRFRDGDQSNMLVFDKHTDAYRDADEAERKRLKQMCDGPFYSE